MITTKTPLRISLGGGGTDLPSYYSKFGGSVISAAINKYIYVLIEESPTKDYVIRVDTGLQITRKPEDIKHPIIRAVTRFWELPPVYISVYSDLPGGTGLGSSGALMVGLVNAVYKYKYSKTLKPQELAEMSFQVERVLLKSPVGKQDQYIASYGGLQHFEIDTGGIVKTTEVMTKEETIKSGLESSLLLFYTGIIRKANDLLSKQEESTNNNGMAAHALHKIKQISYQSLHSLRFEDFKELGLFMHDHWQSKKHLSKGVTTDHIDSLYLGAKQNGAIGGKIVGAGGGGFLLFIADDPDRLISYMRSKELSHVPLKFDWRGSREIK